MIALHSFYPNAHKLRNESQGTQSFSAVAIPWLQGSAGQLQNTLKEVKQAPKSHLSPEFQPLPVCDAYNVVNLFCSLKLSGEHSRISTQWQLQETVIIYSSELILILPVVVTALNILWEWKKYRSIATHFCENYFSCRIWRCSLEQQKSSGFTK